MNHEYKTIHPINGWGAQASDILQVNYYDSYDFLSIFTAHSDSLAYRVMNGYDNKYQGAGDAVSARGMLTGTATRVLNTSGNGGLLVRSMYYDLHGNLVQSHEQNHLGWYDNHARWYDPVSMRFTTPDPLAEKYFHISPFANCANNPINLIDKDGKKTIFVNGYWNRFLGFIDFPTSGGQKYWGSSFIKAANSYFKDGNPNHSYCFIDGSSMWGGDMSGSDRYIAGYKYAVDNLRLITSNMIEGEVFNMVTHSEGSAYGAGVARALIDKGFKVNTILHLAADEGDEFTTPEEADTYQLANDGDWVTGNHMIKGTDKFGLIANNLGLTEVHASVINPRIFKALEDLKTVKIQFNNVTKSGFIILHWNQVKGSTKYNTIFTNLKGNISYEK